MASKQEKIVTLEVIAVGDYTRNREVVQLCVDWLQDQMTVTSWDLLGISFNLNHSPAGGEYRERPSFAIDVTGPKVYLGIDWMRNLENRADCFMAGVRKAWGIRA